jgi:hypothetical protein
MVVGHTQSEPPLIAMTRPSSATRRSTPAASGAPRRHRQCFTGPGHEVDVTVCSSLGVLYQVWEGVIELPAAVRDGLVTLTGPRELLLRLPEALALSPVAPHVRQARAGLPAG